MSNLWYQFLDAVLSDAGQIISFLAVSLALAISIVITYGGDAHLAFTTFCIFELLNVLAHIALWRKFQEI